MPRVTQCVSTLSRTWATAQRLQPSPKPQQVESVIPYSAFSYFRCMSHRVQSTPLVRRISIDIRMWANKEVLDKSKRVTYMSWCATCINHTLSRLETHIYKGTFWAIPGSKYIYVIMIVRQQVSKALSTNFPNIHISAALHRLQHVAKLFA